MGSADVVVEGRDSEEVEVVDVLIFDELGPAVVTGTEIEVVSDAGLEVVAVDEVEVVVDIEAALGPFPPGTSNLPAKILSSLTVFPSPFFR